MNENPIPPVEIVENELNPVEIVENELNPVENAVEAGENEIENGVIVDEELNWFDSNESAQLNDSQEIDVKPIIEVDGDDVIAFERLFDFNASVGSNEVDPLAVEERQENVETNENANDSSELRDSFPKAIQFESTRIDADEQRDTNSSNETMKTANDDQSSNDNDNTEDEERLREIEANAEYVLRHGQKVIVDNDVEYMHIPNQLLQAIESAPMYEVKANDLLCGNKPFKYFNGNRYFMIAKDNGFIEIGLAENAVNGLINMNKHKRGENFDIIFLKAMLVGFCSSKTIKEVETIDEGIMDLIKGKFIKCSHSVIHRTVFVRFSNRFRIFPTRFV